MSNSPQPPPFSSCKKSIRDEVKWLCFDVDDTLTTGGLLPEVAVKALYDAHRKGLHLMAVTGRSLAWAEMLLRLFPLDAAVGETGAAIFMKREGGRVELLHSEPDEDKRRANNRKRQLAADEVLKKIPAARLATDNMGRVYDTAFDLIEDGPLVEEVDAARIREILSKHGLEVAQSSVHINAWFGSFDKAAMVDRFFESEFSSSLDEQAPQLVYVGDSKNDGSMFCRTPLSVGVANVALHLPALAKLNQAPAYVVTERGGEGFAQVVEALPIANKADR
ncbi:MAG: HAD family phosphatase [Deltaproteobacteria bacterium]|nr:HAD family phosphatase [Deltaproteobacteria bacterium]